MFALRQSYHVPRCTLSRASINNSPDRDALFIMLRAGVFKPFKVPIDLRSELVERSVTHHRAPAGSWLTSPIPAVSLMPKFLFRCRAVSGAVEPPVACPNLHHVVMWSFGQHRL